MFTKPLRVSIRKSALAVLNRAGFRSSVTEADFSKLTERLAAQIDSENGCRGPRVLLVSSNGAGLGHLSRLIGISKELEGPKLIYTLSSAYQKVGLSKDEIIYFPSYGDLEMAGGAWNPLLTAHFGAVVRGYEPDVIVFDGTFVYRGIVECSRRYRKTLVWVQRGCWRDEVRSASRQIRFADQFVDEIIIPRDVAVAESTEMQGHIVPRQVNPLCVVAEDDLLTRGAAREALGLPANKKLFLIQIGAGVINDISDIRAAALKAVENLGDDWNPVLVQNPLNASVTIKDVYSVQAYPLAKYLDAFDAAVFAAGYNSVQESVVANIPAVFVPNLDTKTDDQLRRARGMVDRELGLVALTSDEIETSISKLGDDMFRNGLRERLKHASFVPGAKQAADLIANVADKG